MRLDRCLSYKQSFLEYPPICRYRRMFYYVHAPCLCTFHCCFNFPLCRVTARTHSIAVRYAPATLGLPKPLAFLSHQLHRTDHRVLKMELPGTAGQLDRKERYISVNFQTSPFVLHKLLGPAWSASASGETTSKWCVSEKASIHVPLMCVFLGISRTVFMI